MKKNYFMGFIACAALTMTGCSNDEIGGNDGQTQGEPIEFGTYLGRDAQARGAEIMNEAALQTSSFGVTAFYTGQTAWTSWTKIAPNFMYNQKVEYNNGWAYSPIKYWPTMKGDQISFFAYAPYATSANGIDLPNKDAATGVTSLKFTVADDPANMVDFVAAQAIDQKQKDAAAGGQDAVSFNFKHELSRLDIKVKTSLDLKSESHVVLKEAKLNANGTFYKSATYTFANVSTDDSTKPVGEWSNPQQPTSAYDIANIIQFSKGQKIGGKQYGAEEQTLDITSATAKSILGTDKYLFLIPVIGNSNNSKNTSITFKYDIVTEDSNLNAGYSCTSATKTVYFPENILEQGIAYNVTFIFNVDEIEVSASVADWGTEKSGTDINVPYTPDDATE